MLYVLLVVIAWATLLIPMPRWLSVLATAAVIGVGLLLLIVGLASAYWDSHMRPNDSGATAVWVTGLLLLLSRAVTLVKGLLDSFMTPPYP
ncbi:MAG: hypothetical protein AB7L76_14200 [Burkholderiaceae bacterium]